MHGVHKHIYAPPQRTGRTRVGVRRGRPVAARTIQEHTSNASQLTVGTPVTHTKSRARVHARYPQDAGVVRTLVVMSGVHVQDKGGTHSWKTACGSCASGADGTSAARELRTTSCSSALCTLALLSRAAGVTCKHWSSSEQSSGEKGQGRRYAEKRTRRALRPSA